MFIHYWPLCTSGCVVQACKSSCGNSIGLYSSGKDCRQQCCSRTTAVWRVPLVLCKFASRREKGPDVCWAKCVFWVREAWWLYVSFTWCSCIVFIRSTQNCLLMALGHAATSFAMSLCTYECKCSCHSVCIEEGKALLQMCVLPYKFLLDNSVWHSVCVLCFLSSSNTIFLVCRASWIAFVTRTSLPLSTGGLFKQFFSVLRPS